MGGAMLSSCKYTCGENKRPAHNIDEEELCQTAADILDPTQNHQTHNHVPGLSQVNYPQGNGNGKSIFSQSPQIFYQQDAAMERVNPDTLAELKWDSRLSPRQMMVSYNSRENSELAQRINTVSSTLQNQVTSQNNLRVNTNTNSQNVRTIPAGTNGHNSDNGYSIEAQQSSPLHYRQRMKMTSGKQLQKNKPVINLEFLDKAQISIADAQELGVSMASGLTHETYFDTQDGMLIYSKLTAVNSLFHATQDNNSIQ